MSNATEGRPPVSPRYWLSWLAVGVMWLIGKMPRRIGLWLTAPIGWLAFLLATRRRRIAQRNIERCFPDLSENQHEAMLRAHFRSLARMLFEVCWCWSGSGSRVLGWARHEGLEHFEAALNDERGMMLITCHVTCLEMGGRIAGSIAPGAMGVYRPLKNPVIEWYQNRSRKRYVAGSISKHETRKTVRFLRDGGALWYAPDQDYGAARSEFVPFFGIQTATLKANVQLAALSGCLVVPMFPVFDEATRTWTTHYDPPLENFPSGDMHEDLARINRIFEEKIRLAPEQYWWIHRRFKTRPPGEPPFYEQ